MKLTAWVRACHTIWTFQPTSRRRGRSRGRPPTAWEIRTGSGCHAKTGASPTSPACQTGARPLQTGHIKSVIRHYKLMLLQYETRSPGCQTGGRPLQTGHIKSVIRHYKLMLLQYETRSPGCQTGGRPLQTGHIKSVIRHYKLML